MRRLALPALVIASLAGCIIYDEDVVYRDEEAIVDDGPSRPDRPVEDTTDAADPSDPAPSADPIGVFPSGAAAGETIILSIVRTDEPGAADWDLRGLSGLGFFGPSEIEVLVVQGRNEAESLMTVRIPANSPTGSNDLLLEFENGDALFLEDAFTVHNSRDAAPADMFAGDACPG